MKYLLFLCLVGTAFAVEINSINAPANPVTAQVFCSDGEVRFSEEIRLSNFSPEGQAAWSAAIAYAGSSVLQPNESINSVILEPVTGGAVAAVDGEGNPIAWRDLIRIYITIDTTADGRTGFRYQSITSEMLPGEIRDGLLALYATLKALDRSGLAALAQKSN